MDELKKNNWQQRQAVLNPVSLALCSDNRIVYGNDIEGYRVIISGGKRDGETIVPYGKDDYIDGYSNGYARVNKKIGNTEKWGVIDVDGKIILPLEYDKIWSFYRAKDWKHTIVEKKGEPYYAFVFETGQLQEITVPDNDELIRSRKDEKDPLLEIRRDLVQGLSFIMKDKNLILIVALMLRSEDQILTMMDWIAKHYKENPDEDLVLKIAQAITEEVQ